MSRFISSVLRSGAAALVASSLSAFILIVADSSQANAAKIRQETRLAVGGMTWFLSFDSRFGVLRSASFQLLVSYDHVGELTTDETFDSDFAQGILEPDYWASSNVSELDYQLPFLAGGGDTAECYSANCRESMSYSINHHLDVSLGPNPLWEYNWWDYHDIVGVYFDIEVSTYCGDEGCPNGASIRGGLENFSAVGIMTFEYAQVPLPASLVPLSAGVLSFPAFGVLRRRASRASQLPRITTNGSRHD